jgi:hypothetical protein
MAVAFVVIRRQGRRRAHDVRGMQERRTGETDLDEGRLHPWHHPLHAPAINVADVAALTGALDMHFLQHAVLDDTHAGLARGHVDQDLLAHAGAGRKVRRLL